MENEAWPQSRKARLFGAVEKGLEQTHSDVPESIIQKIADSISDSAAPGCPTCSPNSRTPIGINEPLKPPPNFNPDAPMFSPNASDVENLPEPGSGLERLKDKPQSGIDLTGGILGKGASGRDAGKYTEKLRDY